MQQFDLLGIGNSVVDLLYKVDDVFYKNNKSFKFSKYYTEVDANKIILL